MQQKSNGYISFAPKKVLLQKKVSLNKADFRYCLN